MKQRGGGYFKISGPVSYYIYKIPATDRMKEKRIYLLGDVHTTGWKNACLIENEVCDAQKDCYMIITFINELVNNNIKKNIDTSNNKYIDIFLEIAYKRDTSNRKRINNYIKLLTIEDEKIKLNFNIPTYNIRMIPLMSVIYNNLKCAKLGKCPPYVRFHRMDYRGGLEIFKLLDDIMMIYALIITHRYIVRNKPEKKEASIKLLKKHIDKESEEKIILSKIIGSLIEIFELGAIMQKSIQELKDFVKADMANKYDWSRQELKKIYNKIMSNEERIMRQIDNIVIDKQLLIYLQEEMLNDDMLQKDYYNYIWTLHELKYIVDTSYTETIIFNDTVLNNIMNIKLFVTMFGNIFMDIYTLGRMFRKFKDGTEPENIVIYAGDKHIRNYSQFIEAKLGVISIFKQPKTKEESKCIIVSKEEEEIMNFDI